MDDKVPPKDTLFINTVTRLLFADSEDDVVQFSPLNKTHVSADFEVWEEILIDSDYNKIKIWDRNEMRHGCTCDVCNDMDTDFSYASILIDRENEIAEVSRFRVVKEGHHGVSSFPSKRDLTVRMVEYIEGRLGYEIVDDLNRATETPQSGDSGIVQSIRQRIK